MKRRLAKLVVFLLLGAIVNVAVAWGCAFWPGSKPRIIEAYVRNRRGESHLCVIHFDFRGKLHITAIAGDLENQQYTMPVQWAMPGVSFYNRLHRRERSPEALVPSWGRDELLPWGATKPWPGSYDNRVVVATGWPMRSLWAGFEQVLNPGSGWGWKARHGVVLPDSWQPRELRETPRSLGNATDLAGLRDQRASGLRAAQMVAGRPGQSTLSAQSDESGRITGMRFEALVQRPDVLDSVIIVQAGWPLPSLQGKRWRLGVPFGSHMRGVAFEQSMSGAISDSEWPVKIQAGNRPEYRPVPLEPIWPGFAINVTVYAVISWLLLAAPFKVRRRVRIRRGLCPACAYPVGTSDTCTECGKSDLFRAGVCAKATL